MKALLGFCCLLSAGLQEADGDLKDLAARVKDYAVKFRLIAVGRPALPVLMAQVTNGDPWLAFESKSAMRWIAQHAVGRPGESPLTADAVGFVASPHPPAVRAFAAELLGILGGKEAVASLAPLLRDGDEGMRRAAADALLVARDPAASRALADGLTTADASFKCVLLRALGLRRDPSVIQAIAACASSKDAQVRKAAIEALGSCGDARAAAVLQDPSLRGMPESRAALLALGASLSGDAAAKLFLVVLEEAATDDERVEALRGIGRSGSRSVLPRLREPAKWPPGFVQEAAHHALLSVADRLPPEEAVPICLEVLGRSRENAVVTRALAGAARGHGSAVVRMIESHLHSGDELVAFTALAVLRDLPDPAATAALVQACRKATGPFQKLVIEALGERGDPAGGGALQSIVETGPEEGRSAALEAYLRLAARAAPESAGEMYAYAMRKGIRRPALEGLGRVGDASSIPLVARALEGADGDTRELGVAALVAIGERLLAQGKREGAVAAFRRAHDFGGATEGRLRSMGETVAITARDGRLDAWWILGPFDAPDVASWERGEIPEREIDLRKTYEVGGRTLRWISARTDHKEGILQLDNLIKPNNHVTAYAFAEIEMTREREAVLKMGSDDGIRCWVNGELVLAKHELRTLEADQDLVKVRLREGRNRLLLKICEGEGAWMFSARLEDDQGRPLKFKIW